MELSRFTHFSCGSWLDWAVYGSCGKWFNICLVESFPLGAMTKHSLLCPTKVGQTRLEIQKQNHPLKSILCSHKGKCTCTVKGQLTAAVAIPSSSLSIKSDLWLLSYRKPLKGKQSYQKSLQSNSNEGWNLEKASRVSFVIEVITALKTLVYNSDACCNCFHNPHWKRNLNKSSSVSKLKQQSHGKVRVKQYYTG